MLDGLTQWATLLSPIISVIAIIVALRVARSSSKDAQKQINAIRHLLDVFVAANNLDIVEAQRKYQRQLAELDSQIEDAQILYILLLAEQELTISLPPKKRRNKKHISTSYWPSEKR